MFCEISGIFFPGNCKVEKKMQDFSAVYIDILSLTLEMRPLANMYFPWRRPFSCALPRFCWGNLHHAPCLLRTWFGFLPSTNHSSAGLSIITKCLFWRVDDRYLMWLS